MPTINQLVRKPRKARPAKPSRRRLQRVTNNLKTRTTKSRRRLSAVFVLR